MKKIVLIMVVVILLSAVLALPAYAADNKDAIIGQVNGTTYMNFTYTVNDNTVTITKYNGNAKSVTIPTTINGKKVVEIGKRAFNVNKKLENITISDTVNRIRLSAFSNCPKLSKIIFGKNVSTISKYAFANCPKLKNITLPSELKSLSEGVFYNTGLTSIKISKKIKSINPIALEINSLKKITVAKNNKNFSSKEGVLYNKNQTKLLICPRALSKTKLTVPKTVKTIADGAFEFNKNLKEITLPKKLKKIGMIAFIHCKKLKSITIPKSVVDIDDDAFISSTTIKGYKNSAAQKYAKRYGLKFVRIG